MDVAEQVDGLMLAAGWMPAKLKASSEPAAFYRDEPGHFVISGLFMGAAHVGVGGPAFFHTDPVALARYMIEASEREAKAAMQVVADAPTPPAPQPAPDPITIERVVEVEKLVDNPEHLARIAELEAQLEASRTPAAGEEVIPEGVEDEIPAELAGFADADETAEDFRLRAFLLLQRFGVSEGDHGPDTQPLTANEKILVIEMAAANGAAGNWLRVDLSKLKT